MKIAEKVMEMRMVSLGNITKFCKEVKEKQHDKVVETAVRLDYEGNTSVGAEVWLDDLEAHKLFDEGNDVVGSNVPLLL